MVGASEGVAWRLCEVCVAEGGTLPPQALHVLFRTLTHDTDPVSHGTVLWYHAQVYVRKRGFVYPSGILRVELEHLTLEVFVCVNEMAWRRLGPLPVLEVRTG